MKKFKVILSAIIVAIFAFGPNSVNAESKWSEWMEKLPEEVNEKYYDIETRTLYQYRDKSHTTSTSSTKEGWTKEKEPTTTWGAWSAWQDAAVSSSATRKVETRTVGTGTYSVKSNPGEPYPIPTRNLRQGHTGDDVRWVQKFLNDRWGGSEIDGVYGDNTRNRVIGFQDYFGLSKDGEVGPQTRAKMLEYWQAATKTENTKKQYRYQDSTTTYYWYKWSDWSEWNEKQPEANDDREINTKQEYRYKKIEISIEKAEIKIEKTVYEYTGSAITPAPTVILDGKTLVSGQDYEVAYANNTAEGQAEVIVSGKGIYCGKSVVKFSIEKRIVAETPAEVDVPTQTPSHQTAQAGSVSLVTMDEQEEVDIAGEIGGTDKNVKKKTNDGAIVKGTEFNSKKATYEVISTKNKTVAYVASNAKGKSDVKVPDTIEYKNTEYKVTAIESNAFKNNKKLKKLIIGKNVKKVKKNAFRGCKSLKSVTFGRNVNEIGAYAFYGDKKLSTIKFGTKKLKKIGKKAFGKISKHPNAKVPKEKIFQYQKLIKKAL